MAHGKNFKQGIFYPKNPDKYMGTKPPRYMSSWELEAFRKLDNHPNVLKWGSEIVIVPYFSIPDNKNRRYMVDIYVEFLRNGERVTEIIEIKPQKELIRPKKGRKKAKTYLNELYTYNVNRCKWAAASIYATQRGWKFKVLTERDLFY